MRPGRLLSHVLLYAAAVSNVASLARKVQSILPTFLPPIVSSALVVASLATLPALVALWHFLDIPGARLTPALRLRRARLVQRAKRTKRLVKRTASCATELIQEVVAAMADRYHSLLSVYRFPNRIGADNSDDPTARNAERRRAGGLASARSLLDSLTPKKKTKAKDNWKPTGPDTLRSQPRELTYHVLAFLPAEDLARLGMCARYLARMTNDENLWKELCRVKFMQLKHHPLTLHPAGVYTTTSQMMSRLSAADCKDLLERRGVPRNEWEELCVQEKAQLAEETEEEDPDYDRELAHLRDKVKESEGDKWPVPDLIAGTEFSSKWKASYIGAILDLSRTRITELELVAYPWAYWSGERESRVQFHPEGFRAGLNGFPRRQQWAIDDRGCVQVSSFPTHATDRDSHTGGWSFSNGWVTYRSICEHWEKAGKPDTSKHAHMSRSWYWE